MGLRLACVASGLAMCAAAQAGTIIGGSTPSVRPAGAPSVSTYERNKNWLGWARRGVSAPYPDSLNFLNDQGAWYTPFTARGMPGRYDIRELHALPASQDQTAVKK